MTLHGFFDEHANSNFIAFQHIVFHRFGKEHVLVWHFRDLLGERPLDRLFIDESDIINSQFQVGRDQNIKRLNKSSFSRAWNCAKKY
jgi:hypothetical protein